MAAAAQPDKTQQTKRPKYFTNCVLFACAGYKQQSHPCQCHQGKKTPITARHTRHQVWLAGRPAAAEFKKYVAPVDHALEEPTNEEERK